MPAITNRLPAVTVEYDLGNAGKRTTKKFEDASKAKTFYAKKLKDGKNPKVLNAKEAEQLKTAKAGDTKAKPPAVKPKTTDAPAKPESIEATPKAPGVSYKQTRPYWAGVVVKRHGTAAGVTAAMVAEVDDLYGSPNPRESQFCLKNAWHAVRGYQD